MYEYNNNVQGVIEFPCHSKDKVIVYEGTSGRCSLRCPSCDKFAEFNFDTMSSKESKPLRGAVHKITKQNKYID